VTEKCFALTSVAVFLVPDNVSRVGDTCLFIQMQYKYDIYFVVHDL